MFEPIRQYPVFSRYKLIGLLLSICCLAGCLPSERDFQFEADRYVVAPGEAVTLSWQVKDEYGSGGRKESLQKLLLAPGPGEVSALGQHAVHPEEDTTYFLTAHFLNSQGDEVIRESTISVAVHSLPFEADQYSVQPGQPVTLSWDLAQTLAGGTGDLNLVSAELQPDRGSVSPLGSFTVHPEAGVSYQLVARYRDSQGRERQWEETIDIAVTPNEDEHPDAFDGDESYPLTPIAGVALPHRKQRLGTFRLGCKGNNRNKCANMSRAVARFYTRNSRGKFQVQYTGTSRGQYVFKVDPKSNNNNVSGLSSYLKSVAIHEMGHRIGLGHSKKLARIKKGPMAGKQGQDYSTVMNGRARGARYLLAPQYYHKGWLPDAEVALYDGTQQVFELKRVSDFSADGLTTVIVTSAAWNRRNPGVGNPIFISYPSPGNCRFKANSECVALHFLMGGGTRMISTFDKGEYVFARGGLKVEMLTPDNPDRVRIRVTLVPQA